MRCVDLPGIYGLITAVIINGKMDAANYSAYSGALLPSLKGPLTEVTRTWALA